MRIPDDLMQEPVHRRFIFLFVLCGGSLRWRLAVNKSPAVFIFYYARLTEFEEKLEDLRTG